MMKWILLLFLSFLLSVFYSCKKQEKPQLETVLDTVKVNADFIYYGLSENTIVTLDAYAPDATSYLWIPGNYDTPSINVDLEGQYTVQVTTHSQFFTYVVVVYYEGSDSFIPNSFTPNGDGINDVWRPSFFNINNENFQMHIYSPENVKLFSSADKNSYWDGKYNGTIMPVGYYYYTIGYQKKTGENKSLNGMLQLLM